MEELISAALAAFSEAAKKSSEARGTQDPAPARRQIPSIMRQVPAPRADAVSAKPPVPRAPVPPAMPEHERDVVRSGVFDGMFEDGKNLLRAVVAAEVLGPPAALRENAHWQIRRMSDR